MKFKKEILIFILILFIFSPLVSSNQEERGMDQISEMIYSIPGLIPSEQRALVSAFDRELGGEMFNKQIRVEHLESMERVVSAGIFEEVDPGRIAEVVHKVYQAELNGAPTEYVEDLALIGFVQSVTAQQLEVSAKTLSRLSQTDVDPIIYQDVISYGMAYAWPAETIAGVSEGLIKGKGLGLDVGKLALAMIIRVDQGLKSKSVAAMVEEEIDFIKKYKKEDQSEKERRDSIYRSMQNAIAKGVPSEIAQELYYEAVEEKWNREVSEAVFEGMVESHRIGLTPEKIALAMIIRVEQGLGATPPKQMVREEIAYVAEKEKKRLEIIRDDKTLDYSKSVPKPQRYEVYVEPKKPEPEPKVYRQSGRTRVNLALMDQSIKSFLGTPYRWGGNTRRGTDCSGFTQSVYREQGVYIPRNSRQQCRVGKSVGSQNLQYGDLVFFSKYGYGRINHVGIYVGNGRFAHASCSKGVTISHLTKRYYRVRYEGGRKIV